MNSPTFENFTDPSAPFPLGFNVAFEDGRIQWYAFEYDKKPYPSAPRTWTCYGVEFFQVFDGD
jgi:hypothetical protein